MTTREQIAKIIDPDAYANWDRYFNCDAVAHQDAVTRAQMADYNYREDINEALAKADRILALSPPKGDVLDSDLDALTCDQQFALAKRIAANIGYVLLEEPSHPDSPHERSMPLQDHANRAVADEREACAKTVESFAYEAWNKDYSRKEVSEKVAHAIRARAMVAEEQTEAKL